MGCIQAWFKEGSGTFAGTARRVLRTKVPDPFLNHACIRLPCVPVQYQITSFRGNDEYSTVVSSGRITILAFDSKSTPLEILTMISRFGKSASLMGILVLAMGGSASAGVVTFNPVLPSDTGDYRPPEQVHAEFIGPDLLVVLEKPIHKPFSPATAIDEVGSDELETFDSSLTGTAIVTSSALGLEGVPIPLVLSGPVQTAVRGKVGQTTGTWDTEMVSMSLTGDVLLPFGPPLVVVVRESPTLQSTGQTTITDLGRGEFQIDSFFDVFTELSLDGGLNFIPSTGSTRMILTPEPSSVLSLLSLVAVGCIGGIARYRRRLAA